MSKAIYGHLAAGDAALLAEISRLRRRVAELEEQLAAHQATDLDRALRSLHESEPVLT